MSVGERVKERQKINNYKQYRRATTNSIGNSNFIRQTTVIKAWRIILRMVWWIPCFQINNCRNMYELVLYVPYMKEVSCLYVYTDRFISVVPSVSLTTGHALNRPIEIAISRCPITRNASHFPNRWISYCIAGFRS